MSETLSIDTNFDSASNQRNLIQTNPILWLWTAIDTNNASLLKECIDLNPSLVNLPHKSISLNDLVSPMPNETLVQTQNLLPLHKAVMSNRLEMAKILLENGAKANQPCDALQYTDLRPIHLCAKNCNTDIAKLLVEDYGASVDFFCSNELYSNLSVLHIASMQAAVKEETVVFEFIRYILSCIKNEQSKQHLLNSKAKHASSGASHDVLYFAILNESIELLQLLLSDTERSFLSVDKNVHIPLLLTKSSIPSDLSSQLQSMASQ